MTGPFRYLDRIAERHARYDDASKRAFWWAVTVMVLFFAMIFGLVAVFTGKGVALAVVTLIGALFFVIMNARIRFIAINDWPDCGAENTDD